MNFEILHKTARSVVIELAGKDKYRTEPYEIYVNGTWLRTDEKMVTIVNGLMPDTCYEILLKRGEDSAGLSVRTEREFVTLNVRKFGAKGDGNADDTAAIQTAILCCPPDSRVYIPAGTYRIRNLFLKSNLILEIGKGALLQAFQTREEFPVLPGIIESLDGTEEYNLGSWEGNPLDTMASIITGIHVDHVVICGEGTIDGGGDFETWWVAGVNQNPPYRPRMIFLNHCRDITIQGIRIQNSPSWNVHPYFCENIRIYGISLNSPDKSHNTDGIDPESCRGVEIAGVHFSVGDDCIALKSGKIYMGRKHKQPSEGIRIRQCLMERGHGAVTVGSEIAGGVRDVEVSRCIFQDTDRGLRIKTRRGRGRDSVVDGIVFKDIYMNQVKSPFVVNCFYYCDPDGRTEYVADQNPLPVDERTPEIRSLEFENIICEGAHHTGICIYGLPERKIESVKLKQIRITYEPQAQAGIAAMMLACQPTRHQGIYAQNVKKLVLEDVQTIGASKEFEFLGIDEMG